MNVPLNMIVFLAIKFFGSKSIPSIIRLILYLTIVIFMAVVILSIKYLFGKSEKNKKILKSDKILESYNLVMKQIEREEVVGDKLMNAKKLSSNLGLSQQSINFAISESGNKSFNELINEKRIELAQKKLITLF